MLDELKMGYIWVVPECEISQAKFILNCTATEIFSNEELVRFDYTQVKLGALYNKALYYF